MKLFHCSCGFTYKLILPVSNPIQGQDSTKSQTAQRGDTSRKCKVFAVAQVPTYDDVCVRFPISSLDNEFRQVSWGKLYLLLYTHLQYFLQFYCKVNHGTNYRKNTELDIIIVKIYYSVNYWYNANIYKTKLSCLFWLLW